MADNYNKENVGPDRNEDSGDSDSEIPNSVSTSISRNGIIIDASVYNPPNYAEETNEETNGNPDIPNFNPNPSVNSKPLSKYAQTYELEKFEKNLMVIFNQKNVIGYEPRRGTEKDVQALGETFTKFGFEIEEHTDCTKRELFNVLNSFNHRNFSDYGCVAVVVLTHGSLNGRLRAKDQHFTEFDIIEAFKTHDKPSLITKPKLLIIQACRGKQTPRGVTVDQNPTVHRDIIYDFEPYTLPVESDMFVLHSSYMGNPSHRDQIHGTWLIQTLCKKIMQLAPSHDLEYIVTEVKRAVAIDKTHEEYNTHTLEIEINKQIPVVTSTLIRKLYLKKYGDDTSFSDIACSREYYGDLESGPCLCFLDYFRYIKNCLELYSKENPDDVTATSFLEISETLEETVEFNTAKKKMCKAIVNHLDINAKDYDFFKYIYLKQ